MIHTLEFSNLGDLPEGLVFATAHTNSLSGRGDCSFVVPHETSEAMPLVILLHGVHGSHWSWPLLGHAGETLTRLVAAREVEPMVLAMPSDGLAGYGSAYLDDPGRRVTEWITSDVPEIAAQLTPQIGEVRFIAGLSMGGWGAIRLAMTGPIHFSAVSTHSTITSLADLSLFEAGTQGFSSEFLTNGEDDLVALLSTSRRSVPPLRLDCGTDDPLIRANRKLHQRLLTAGIPHQYQEYSGGHTWEYWREHLTESLQFFQSSTHE